MKTDFTLSRAQESRAEIEKLYIVMRHLFNRGYYKPFGVSGSAIREALLTLSPEIYGSIKDSRKVELDGLIYVIDRLPKGIEQCRFVKLISEEGYGGSQFKRLVPAARRRNCYMVDEEQMFVEVTRGRSEIYDILTHLTFLYNEAEKIRRNAFTEKGEPIREFQNLERIACQEGEDQMSRRDLEVAFSYISILIGRTFDEVRSAYERLAKKPDKNSGLFKIVYHLGRNAQEEAAHDKDRVVSFTPLLRERIGHHIYGEKWANSIKQYLHEHKMLNRPIHIVSANLHSFQNAIFARTALGGRTQAKQNIFDLATTVSMPENAHLRNKISAFAAKNGMHTITEEVGTHIYVQVFDTDKIPVADLQASFSADLKYIAKEKPVIIVMDYAFGEQAFETMDELLKPYSLEGQEDIKMNVASISIMGKAGILQGDKGDLMVPTAHVFEGTADNYPFQNDLVAKDFEGNGLQVFEGPMVTVLGTSLQNKDILFYFKESSWQTIGLEMEGAHYQKAIQSAACIRKSISPDVVLRYAYYASDNPLLTGSTLASGSLGEMGVKPTYLITLKILEKILNPKEKK